jgi:hypothetical protein
MSGRISGNVSLTIRTLETAVDSLHKQLEVANASLLHERGRVDRAEQQINELQAELAAERRRLIAVLTGPERVPWWRRWFR